MSVAYRIITRRDPSDPEAPETYHPSVRSSGRVTIRDLAETLAVISTVSSADTYAVLEALVSIIPKELAKGNLVELGDLGSFSIRIRTTGAETQSGVSSDSITNVLPRFYPGKRFKQVLEQIEFVKAASG